MTSNTFTADSALAALRSTQAKGPPPPPLEQAAFDTAHSAIHAALPQGAEALLDATAKAWERADRLWETIRATPAFALGTRPSACRRGCGWCCHQRVGAAAVEVLTMARALRQRPQALAALAAWQPGQPCAFLKDGACSVYDVRPLKCRSLWHMDERHCMGKYAGLPAFGAVPSADFQLEPKMIYEGALKGLALPLIKAGRDCPGLELMPALRAVIDHADAAERWAAGEKVFPEQARLDWFPAPAKTKAKTAVKRKGR
ncbi:MAG TPA: YkgJ family cysteine cluster protein [Magnetospirillum sp.]|nr:YkgJ family cysteine cluster protein [Magnetospirillum sp.]